VHFPVNATAIGQSRHHQFTRRIDGLVRYAPEPVSLALERGTDGPTDTGNQ